MKGKQGGGEAKCGGGRRTVNYTLLFFKYINY